MLHRNRTRANSLIVLFVIAVAQGAFSVAGAQSNPQQDVERVIRDFLVPFGNRDVAAFGR